MADETVDETRDEDLADLDEQSDVPADDEPEAPVETGPSRGKLFAAR